MTELRWVLLGAVAVIVAVAVALNMGGGPTQTTPKATAETRHATPVDVRARYGDPTKVKLDRGVLVPMRRPVPVTDDEALKERAVQDEPAKDAPKPE